VFDTHHLLQTTKRLLVSVSLLVLAPALWAAPKHVILMIGDGMGPDSVYAAGAYQYGAAFHTFTGGQRLTLETLANHYYTTTFMSGGSYDATWAGGDAEYVKKNTTDSAAAATTMACGVKTYNGALSVGTDKQPLRTIFEEADARGVKTGLVTSKFFCDATPAAFAAHNESRNNYLAVAHDMIFTGSPDVIIGAGNPEAAGKTPSYTYISEADWSALRNGTAGYKLLQTRDDFRKLVVDGQHDPIFGAYRGYPYLKARLADNSGADPEEPTLAEMSLAALRVLDTDTGFIVMIEGGLIDERNHANDLNGSIGETLGFDEAVTTVIDWISKHGGWEQNLLIITADHETGYLNSVQPTGVKQLPTVKWGTAPGGWGSHTNRLVDVYTQGSGCEAFAGYAQPLNDFERGPAQVIDDTDIFRVMKAALPAAP
jgi:alkaline phosphatase